MKMNKYSMTGVTLAVALAAGAPVQAATEASGLRIVVAHRHDAGSATRIETRISRGLETRLLTPQALRVALVTVAGTVRAEQQRLVGPAQLPHGNARDIYLSTELKVVAAPDDRVVVEWVKTGL